MIGDWSVYIYEETRFFISSSIRIISLSPPPIDVKAAVKDNTKSSPLESYPIGSIYFTVENKNPSQLFGGTWKRWGKGKVPVSIDEDDIDFLGSEKTGGEKEHKLAGDELPKHNHSFSGTAISTGTQSADHTHTGTSGNQSANHTHTGTSGGVSANHDHGSTGTVSANHTHSYTYTNGVSATALTVTQMPSHTHGVGTLNRYAYVSPDGYIKSPDLNGIQGSENEAVFGNMEVVVGTNWYGSLADTGCSQGHTHGASTQAANSGTISANHSHSTGNQSANHTHTTTTGNPSQNHTHTTTTGGISAGHTHTLTPTGSLSNSGNDKKHNNIQPYITCYMWKRTA